MTFEKRIHMNRRTLLRSTLIGAAATLVLASCSSETSLPDGALGDPNNAQLTFWDNNAGPDRTPLYEELIRRFEAANPGIDIQYVGLPSDSAQQKYQTALAGGSAPDLGIVSTAYLAPLVAQDAVISLDDFMAASPQRDEYDAGILESARESGGGEHLYGLPYTSNNATLWYRADWFAEAGIEPPDTYDEFYEAARTLTDKDAGRYGFTIRGGAGSIYPLLQYMFASTGIESFFEDGESTLNRPEMVDAIERFAALYDVETPTADVNNGFPQMVASFGGGSVAMMQHNLGSLSNHEKALGDKVGAVALPRNEDGKRTVMTDPFPSYTVFKSSQHQAASWKFLEFMTSQESQAYWNEHVGQIPVNKAARSAPEFASMPSVQAALAALDDPKTVLVTPPDYLPDFGKIVQVQMLGQWQKVLIGQLSAQDFADDFAEKLDHSMAKYVARQGK
ncbi:carbohydrate ABC transporter substrate-binding protein, CUT1 family [Rhodococcus jostii]|uniref:Carbohydrate ABC transporter substrate-binding protein, CUT1 family n=2 Tax=Rhodococcus jostii TaxID=132919 RepID=A0A1H5I7W9_RHOJO|nr:carbohydrate ABC transporter substrate-binding protein, CUT1 family [Rhodococcus jostii]